MKASITQRLVSSVKPSAKVYDIADDKLTGFILRVYPSGKLVYYVRPQHGSMRKIGNAPAFTPTQARETASGNTSVSQGRVSPRVGSPDSD